MESIDKLSEYADKLRVYPGVMSWDQVARGIDSIAEDIEEEIEAEISERYMPLPLDADGVPIRIGDVLDPPADCDDYVPLQVMRLMYDGYEQEWFFDGQAGGFCGMAGEHMDVAGWTHHHAPTIEDVLEQLVAEFADDTDAAVIHRYADEIRGMK